MTIKQNGGVFGRNPTFNDVTIDGTLTFDGDIDINSDLKIDGDLEVTGTSKLTGNVGIGKSSGSNALELQGEALFGSGTDGIKLTYSGGSSTGIIDTGYTSTGIEFRVGNVKKLVLNSSGNLEMNSGSGIDFSATAGTGTSELLDDYEEGTWTPTITGSTSGSVAGITINRAAYTKIGNQVTVYFYISAVNLDTASLVGNVEIGGLPFNSANSFMQLAAVNYTDFFSFDESDISVGGYVHSGTKVKLLKGSSVSGIPVGELSGTAQVMMFGMTYESS